MKSRETSSFQVVVPKAHASNSNSQGERRICHSVDGVLPATANGLANVEGVAVEETKGLVENVLETEHVEDGPS